MTPTPGGISRGPAARPDPPPFRRPRSLPGRGLPIPRRCSARGGSDPKSSPPRSGRASRGGCAVRCRGGAQQRWWLHPEPGCGDVAAEGRGARAAAPSPRRRAKLNRQRASAVILSPPGSQPPARPLLLARRARTAAPPGPRAVGLSAARYGATPRHRPPRGAATPLAPGIPCLRRSVLPSRPSNSRTQPAAWEEMSVAGKQPPPAPLERPGSLLVPTWASTRAPRARPGTYSRGRSGRAAPAYGSARRAGGRRLREESGQRGTASASLSGRNSAGRRKAASGRPAPPLNAGPSSPSAMGKFRGPGEEAGRGIVSSRLVRYRAGREAGSWERFFNSWQCIWQIIYK